MNGKIKGSKFERDVAKAISRKLSHGERDDLVWRTASSGGRFTQGVKRGILRQNSAGDIASTSPEAHKVLQHYVIECKHYRTVHYRQWLFSRSGEIAEWLAKASAEAMEKLGPFKYRKASHVSAETIKEEYTKFPVFPVLIFRENYTPINVILGVLHFPSKSFGRIYRCMTFNTFLEHMESPEVFLQLDQDDDEITVIRFHPHLGFSCKKR